MDSPAPTLAYATPASAVRLKLLALGAVILASGAALNALWQWKGIKWLIERTGLSLSLWALVLYVLPPILFALMVMAVIVLFSAVITRPKNSRGRVVSFGVGAAYTLFSIANTVLVMIWVLRNLSDSWMQKAQIALYFAEEILELLLVAAALGFMLRVGRICHSSAITGLSLCGIGMVLVLELIGTGHVVYGKIVEWLSLDQPGWFEWQFHIYTWTVLGSLVVQACYWLTIAVIAWKKRTAPMAEVQL